MGIISDCRRAFPEAGVPQCEDFYGKNIALCNSIYKGEPPWAYVRKSGLYGRGRRRMSMLGCAKVLCDTMASLTFSTQADIICGTAAQQKFVTEVLRENAFWENMPRFFSRAYALGGGVMKVFLDKGKICLDCVDADCFVPTGNGMGRITEGIFRSSWSEGGRRYVMLEHHGMKDGHPVIDRKLYSGSNGSGLREADLSEKLPQLEEHSEYGMMAEPMFAYFRPAAANNQAEGSMLGISCFGNCIDTLKALDVAFDSLSREFVLGRKRIIVPSSCIRTVVDPDSGQVSRYFDADDEVYQALKCDEERDLKITDNTTELRITEHREAINALLDILCFQTGLSAGTLSFSGSSAVRTAAEIKSIENRTEGTMQQNRNMAAEMIEKIVRCIIRWGIASGKLKDEGDISVRIAFSDMQNTDMSEIIDRNIRLVEAGLRSRCSAVMAVLDCSEEEALAELERIKKEEKEWTRTIC